MSSIRLADYLFSRLRQLGIGSIHGVPGDYNLTLLDYVEPAGLCWVGNANELNAAYATDAYARIKGMGALITTFGVGELSAINAIAGAYTERSPVVHIVGTPARASQDSRLLIHHTFNDGEYKRFAQIHSHVTVAQARLWDPRMAPQQIDDLLSQCIHHSRPVYLEVPVDLVSVLVPSDRLEEPVALPKSGQSHSMGGVLNRIMDMIHTAKQPYLFFDGESRPLGILDDIQTLMKATSWPTWTTPFGKGLLDETVSNFHGIYRGDFDDAPVKSFIEAADLVLCFGPHYSSSNTYGYSNIPKQEITISFSDTEVKIGNETFRDIPARDVVPELIQKLDHSRVNRYHTYPALSRDYGIPVTEPLSDQPLAQDRLWRVLSNILRPGDIVLGETGTAGYGVREMPLPKHVRVFTPVTWLSIGFMLPGAQGAALAQQELIEESKYSGNQDARTILLIGDGSFQMTAQELATIIRHDLNVIVFLINNDGYTIERCIHGRNQSYNDIPRWRYLEAPSFFGAQDVYTKRVNTYGELKKVMSSDQLVRGKGLRMIELMVHREDAPKGPLLHYLETQKAFLNGRS